MTPEEKQAWIYAEEHKVGDSVELIEAAKKADLHSWDKKLRILSAYFYDLKRAANDSGQLELFDVITARPEVVDRIMTNPQCGL